MITKEMETRSMTLSYWQEQTRASAVGCDVAVVGGGIIGCSTAYWLHRLRPELQVALIEAGELAQGASGRNAGFLLQGTEADYITAVERYGEERARKLYHFTRENRDLIFSELRGQAFELEASGSLTVAGTAEEDERLQRAVSRMRSDGAPVAYIPPRETNRRLMARGFGGGLFVPSGGMLHPARLVRYLAAESGADVYTHHRAIAVEPDGSGVRLETPRRAIRAAQVVLALNAYLPQLYPALSRYVRPVRAQMLATAPAAERWLEVPVYSHEGYFYIRQRSDGRLLVGGARHLHADAEVGYEDTPTAGVQASLERYLHHHWPQARGLAVEQRWSGSMGFSPDHLPVLGRVPDLPGSFWAAGFTGHGMGYGFRFGRLLAEMVLGRASSADAALFGAERFDEKPAYPARAAS